MTTRTLTGRPGFAGAPLRRGDGAFEPEIGPSSKRALVRRFRRIEGQARGLQKMVEDDRDTSELLMQIASVREALHSAAALILEGYLANSAATILLADSPADTEQLLERTVAVFRKWVTGRSAAP